MLFQSLLTPNTLSIATGLLGKNRASLAKAITLAESSRVDHKEEASRMLEFISNEREKTMKKVKDMRSNTLRIGIAGPPGAGKSTFIECLGKHFVANDKHVAVIAVDPSSHVTGGSIMGDKTRMEELSNHEKAYVRASPTRGVLGGIAEHTADVVYLCESAGYDVIIVESVGLGQSEVEIDQAVDILLLIIPPGGGDDLQASKKGIMEAADMVIVNKADGPLLTAAKHTKADYSGYISFIRRKNPLWEAVVLLMSNHSGLGFDQVTSKIKEFHEKMSESGGLSEKRAKQGLHWMWTQLQRDVVAALAEDEAVKTEAQKVSSAVATGNISSRVAAKRLFAAFKSSPH